MVPWAMDIDIQYPTLRGEASLLIYQCQHFFLLVSLTFDTIFEQYFTLRFQKYIVVSPQPFNNYY